MRMTLLEGNTFDILKGLPDNSVDLCITSPPYWGLRTYGTDPVDLEGWRGEYGSEPTMEMYLDHTLLWVDEVFRVLKESGSFIFNIGDSFFGSYPLRTARFYKEKQLLSVSSFAYCKIISETDFVCRGEHIWAKPNVPSPIRTRLKHSHEKLFWFVKDADKTYFDSKPWTKKVKLEIRPSTMSRQRSVGEQLRYMRGKASGTTVDSKEGVRLKERNNASGEDQSSTPGKRGCRMTNTETIEHSWRVVPVGEKQAGFEMEIGKVQSEHVAPFNSALIEPYIKSLCPPHGVVLDPFLGSGTTMRVAMENFRDSIGIELNKSSIEYAKKRLNWGQGLDCEYLTNADAQAEAV